MSDTKFTPGPWFVSSANKEDYEIGIQSAIGYQWHVCDVCDDMPDDHVANAHLIAAAPELYDALEGLLQNYKYNKRKGLGISPIMKAQKALAKARGE